MIPNRRGGAYAFLVILIAIFVVGLVYVIFTRVFMEVLIPVAEQSIGAATYPNGTAVNNTDALNTISLIKTIWNYWPLIAILGFIVVGFIMAQRRDPNEYSF